MGGVFSSCCGDSSTGAKFSEFMRGPEDPQQAQRDRDARERAAAQAEARQQRFEQSAVGRAAIKSVQKAKQAETRAPAGGVSAGDWLS